MDQQVNQAVNQQPARQQKERPAQVTVLAALAMLAGVIGVGLGVYIVLTGTVFSAALPAEDRPPSGAILLGFLGLAIGGLYIGFSIGAWRLRTWAWSLGLAAGALAIIVNGLRLIYDIFVFIKGDPISGVVLPILALIFGGVVLYYLFSDEVQRAFDL
jgi:hypothetical protein